MNRILVLLALLVTAWPATADVFRPDDVCGPASVGSPRISPDGSAVVFTVDTCSLDANAGSSDLWYVSTEPGAEPVQLTTDGGGDWSPAWSPDGDQLAFVSSRSGSAQIWRFDGFFGEPRQVTDQPGGASSPVWTPDGEAILYTSRAPSTTPDASKGEDVAVHRDLLYRKGREPGRNTHVYKVSASGGAATKLTSGDHDWGEVAVSPDGTRMALVREADHVGGLYSIDTDVYVASIRGGAPRKLTDNPGPDHQPAWTADGESVITRSILEPGYESGKRRLLVWPAGGGEPTELTAGVDRHVYRYRLAPDGRSVIALMDGEGVWQLARLDLQQPGVVEELTRGHSWIWDLDVAADAGTVVFERTDATHPSELFVLDGPRRLTTFNDSFVDGRLLSVPQRHWLQGADSLVESWYYPPATHVQGPRTPMIVTLHGGPQWCVGDRFDPEIQALTGAGYAVLAVNFTGSMGYGQEFMDAIIGDWGGAPARDVLMAVEQIVDKGLADPGRVGVTGGSYGGFLAAHLIGQTDSFGAAVVCRAVLNQVSEYGTTDEQFFDENDIPGTPWSNPEGYARWSPLTYVDKVHTPTMLIHSDEDHRVPVGQAEEYFTALLRHGVTAELIRFPGEGHGLSRHGTPVHRRERLQHMIRWFDTHLK